MKTGSRKPEAPAASLLFEGGIAKVAYYNGHGELFTLYRLSDEVENLLSLVSGLAWILEKLLYDQDNEQDAPREVLKFMANALKGSEDRVERMLPDCRGLVYAVRDAEEEPEATQ